MPYITTPDGVELFYQDQGSGRPVLFSHGWPLCSDAWDLELKVFADAGFRAIAHDRRGHGRSSRSYAGNDMDHYASDLAALVDHLDLRELALVGHSTGGGEVIRYAARHGAGRVRKIVTVGAVPPVMLKSDTNTEGTPIEAFDAIRAGVLTDRSQYYLDLSEAFYGASRAGADVSIGLREDFWRQGMLVGLASAYDCVRAFSETDFTEDLLAIDAPLMVAHGDDDQIVPIAAAALKTATIVPTATLKVYLGAPHGVAGTYQAALDADILAFISS